MVTQSIAYRSCTSHRTPTQIFYQPHPKANFFPYFLVTAQDGQEIIFTVSDTHGGVIEVVHRMKIDLQVIKRTFGTNLFTIAMDPGYGSFIFGHMCSCMVYNFITRGCRSGIPCSV